jgi:phage minor structural protein
VKGVWQLFIDIDYNKRVQKARLHLAKPNKRIISVIDEAFNKKMSIKLGNINELDFSIPHFIENGNGEQVQNEHIDTIKEKMLIRVTLGAYKEWYIVDSIEEDGDDSDVFNVKAFSLGYENKGKRVSGYTEDSINATGLLTNLLSTSVWKIGEVDAMFDNMYRSFDSGDDSNVLDCITNAGETYGALIVWDTENRKVSFKDATKQGQFRGMTVNYGRFLSSIKRTRTTDEMVTRMYVYGSDNLSIQSVNPTGQPYIENFGYFMYPFERDANRNIINHSYFMSDELCNALLDHEELVNQNSPAILAIQQQIADENTQLITEQTKLTDLNNDMASILGLLDVAQSSGDQATIDARKADRDAKQSEIDQQQAVVDNLQLNIESKQTQLDSLTSQVAMGNVFTQDLLDELSLFIIESVWRDDRYIDATELYNDAVKKFDEIRQPKVVIDVTIENLLNIIEEQYYWDKITLGDLIKIKYPQMKIEYMATIIQIDYDLDATEISLTIANTNDLLSDTDKLVQLLYSSSNASSIIQTNKYKWDRVKYVQDQVLDIINSEWDATKNKITAGVNNSVEVGNRGIIIKNPDYPNEVVIMQSGVIALSKDNGETWKTAIKPDGIIAEQLIGQVIVGQNLLITNSSGSFTMDSNGARFDVNSFVIHSGSDNTNLVDNWQNASDFVNSFTDDSMITAYEKSNIKTQWDRIAQEYISLTATIDGYYGDTKSSQQFVIDYDTKYTNLYNYLFEIPQSDGHVLLDDASANQTTRIDANQYKTAFNDYYSARDETNKQLSLRAIELANQAQSSADSVQSKIDEVQNDIVYKTELHSTNGDLFSNGNITTTLYVVVYKGKDDITDTLPNSAFKWRRSDENGVQDTTWNNTHNGVGKSIQVTRDDVHRKATFWCDIDIP